jgi:hypothetical protein
MVCLLPAATSYMQQIPRKTTPAAEPLGPRARPFLRIRSVGFRAAHTVATPSWQHIKYGWVATVDPQDTLSGVLGCDAGLDIACGGRSVVWTGSGGQTSGRRDNQTRRRRSTEWSDRIEVPALKVETNSPDIRRERSDVIAPPDGARFRPGRLVRAETSQKVAL